MRIKTTPIAGNKVRKSESSGKEGIGGKRRKTEPTRIDQETRKRKDPNHQEGKKGNKGKGRAKANPWKPNPRGTAGQIGGGGTKRELAWIGELQGPRWPISAKAAYWAPTACGLRPATGVAPHL